MKHNVRERLTAIIGTDVLFAVTHIPCPHVFRRRISPRNPSSLQLSCLVKVLTPVKNTSVARNLPKQVVDAANL